MLVKVLREALLKQIYYNVDTGIFTYIAKAGCKGAGQIAGTLHHSGYIHIKVNGKSYTAHRLAWLYVNGNLPELLDHVNGVKTDNRLVNLRLASYSENNSNTCLRKDSTTGIKGISIKNNTRYYCQVRLNGVNYNKSFTFENYLTKEQALAAAISWVKTTRETLHKQFTNHGDLQC